MKKLREGISSIDTLYMYVYLHVAIMTRERKNTFIHRFSLITWKLFMLLNLSYWKHISRVRKFVSNVFCSGVSPKKLLILQQVRLQALFVNISTFYMEKHYRFVIKGKIVLTTSDESIFSTLSLSYDKSFMKVFFLKKTSGVESFYFIFYWHPKSHRGE